MTNAEYNNAVGYATKNLCALILHPRSNNRALAMVLHTIVSTAITIPNLPSLCIRTKAFMPANKFTGSNEYPNMEITVQTDTAPLGLSRLSNSVMARQPDTPNP